VTDETAVTESTTQTNDTPVSQTDAPPATVPETAPTETAPAAETDATVLGGETVEETTEAPVGPPEKYELALEGIELDVGLVAEAEPIFRELGLSNDQANALLPLAPKLMEQAQQASLQAMLDAGAQQRKDWLDAFNADPEIGGGKRSETEHLAAKGLDALGFKNTGFGDDGKSPHPFRQALNETGFGNHPDMIRAFRAIGQMAGEDGLFARENPGVREEVPAWKAMYPDDK